MVNKISGATPAQGVNAIKGNSHSSKDEAPVSPAKQNDKLELSPEALELHEKAKAGTLTGSEVEKMNKIKENLSSGFYSSKEVLLTVARKMGNDVSK